MPLNTGTNLLHVQTETNWLANTTFIAASLGAIAGFYFGLKKAEDSKDTPTNQMKNVFKYTGVGMLVFSSGWLFGNFFAEKIINANNSETNSVIEAFDDKLSAKINTTLEEMATSKNISQPANSFL